MKCCVYCGRTIDGKPHVVKHGGRIVHVCADCLGKIARNIAMVDRAFRRAA